MKKLFRIAFAAILLVGCSDQKPGEEAGLDADIAEAKAVIASHEENVRRGDLIAVMSNMADDSVFFVPDMPIVNGSRAIADFYEGILAAGSWDFVHEYDGAEVVGNVVLLWGVSRGIFKPVSGPPATFANNFLIVMKTDGRSYKLWRASFASAGGSG